MTTNVMGTFSLLQAALEYYRSLEGEKRSASASITFPRMRCTAPWERKACSRNHAVIAPIPRIPPAKASSDHLGARLHDTYGLPV